ncbi:hypothetical protein [Arthrobacter sp. StoSoilB13]|uniref:hypothetical protein n=1 Tax=Arthrobacter sp. StoSoilB13 TaxID=2830993 RepID=UPI001CC676B2|nr:hypothetical protein [Arthrobacter sp. StoSoilB13]BCW47917.1 hypothetical protein StoSoilB13_02590 [Arthrobacter sp. StoSoilB13]
MLTGQVGLVADKRFWMGRAILRITRWQYHHVVIATSDTHCISSEPGATRRRLISDYTNIVWSQYAMTEKQAHLIAGIAEHSIGVKYDYLACVAHAVAAITRVDTPLRIQTWLAQRAPTTCSALAQVAVNAAGLRTPHAPLPTPNDWHLLYRARGWVDA